MMIDIYLTSGEQMDWNAMWQMVWTSGAENVVMFGIDQVNIAHEILLLT